MSALHVRWMLFTLLFLAVTSAPLRAGPERSPTTGARIVVNGREVASDTPPTRVGATLLVPLRFIAEALGAAVTWDPRQGVATIQGAGRSVTARAGDPIIRVGDQKLTADAAPRVVQGRIMLPLRTIGAALGAGVDWDARTRTVSIQTAGSPRAGGARPPSGERPPADTPDGPLRVTLVADKKEYRAGEPVKLTLTAQNTGAAPLVLPTSSSQKYDLEVRQGNTLIWKWSDDRMFAQMLGEIRIPANGSVTFPETWPQRDRQGRVVEPGEYTVTGYLTARGADLPRARLTLRILPAQQ